MLPMAADGVGPSYTCSRLVDGMARAGANIDLYVNRIRAERPDAPVRSMMPGVLAQLPYKSVANMSTRLLESRYLNTIEESEIAWLWPDVSLKTHETLAKRGVPILMEGINTRMASAKSILDAAYDAFGAPASHGITQARIDEEEAKLATALGLFAPSPDVETALIGSALEGRFIASSYGVDTTKGTPTPPRAPGAKGARVVYLFCGFVCVRIAADLLLDLWKSMPKNAELRLVGRIEPIISRRFEDVLNAENVTPVGFTRDVMRHYREADVFVFPTLEEGDALVTYEAAFHGLPLITSPAGAGRMGVERDCVTQVPPEDVSALEAAVIGLLNAPERRFEEGQTIQTHVMDYDWRKVGARRLEALDAYLVGESALTPATTPAPVPAANAKSATQPTGKAANTSMARTPGALAGTSKGPSAGKTRAKSARKSPSKVSVVLPANNRAAIIKESIDSVLRQTWEDFELIVVDDCSTDDTYAVVEAMEDPRIKLMKAPQNGGPSAARNIGIKAAEGEWIAFQDSDDEWLPMKLERQMARVQNSEAGCVAVYCGMAVEGSVFETKDKRSELRYIPPSTVDVVEGELAATLWKHSIISTQMLVAKRDALLDVGGFDENLQALVDWDLCLRLAEIGTFGFVDQVLVIQRFSLNSITRNMSSAPRRGHRSCQNTAINCTATPNRSHRNTKCWQASTDA